MIMEFTATPWPMALKGWAECSWMETAIKRNSRLSTSRSLTCNTQRIARFIRLPKDLDPNPMLSIHLTRAHCTPAPIYPTIPNT